MYFILEWKIRRFWRWIKYFWKQSKSVRKTQQEYYDLAIFFGNMADFFEEDFECTSTQLKLVRASIKASMYTFGTHLCPIDTSMYISMVKTSRALEQQYLWDLAEYFEMRAYTC